MAGITIRVLVADDYEPFRRLVSSILQKQPQLQLVGEASDGVEAVQKAQELKADIILLDVNLPKLNGFEVARRIREAFRLQKTGKRILAHVKSSLQLLARKGCHQRGRVLVDSRPEYSRGSQSPECRTSTSSCYDDCAGGVSVGVIDDHC